MLPLMATGAGATPQQACMSHCSTARCDVPTVHLVPQGGDIWVIRYAPAQRTLHELDAMNLFSAPAKQGVLSRQRTCSTIDLPAPEGPSTMVMWPARNLPDTACSSWYRSVRANLPHVICRYASCKRTFVVMLACSACKRRKHSILQQAARNAGCFSVHHDVYSELTVPVHARSDAG